ncbi:MAG TPA: DNA ligase D [Candidatus Eisenbacteria bacterium]|nr:DNA ligase D [Candidatus Eisenbacteria bacterium]
MGLRTYHEKRDFARTPEPRGRAGARKGARFVIQKHDATRLHYDFRLELDGVLKSWAVPRGPSLDPAQRRLAVEVEDHPVEYGRFEGTIPEGEYGAGPVLLWDRGRWRPKEDAREGLRKGHLKFELEGEKLSGGWTLVRMIGPRSEDGKNWLLIKERDEFAKKGKAGEIVTLEPESVSTGRTIEEIGTKMRPKKAARSRRTRPRRGSRAGSAEEEEPARKSTRRASLDLASLAGARREPLPSRWPPELATLVAQVPSGDEWLHEIKFDGYRVIARLDDGRATLFTRSGQNWTDRFPAVGEAVARLPARRLLLDGEVVVLGPDGISSFQALQNAIKRPAGGRLVYFVFDLLHQDGWGLGGVALEERKRALSALLSGQGRAGAIRYSDHVIGQGEAFFGKACQRGLEGVVSKRRASLARHGRGTDWLKIKCSWRQEFVIAGYTEPKRSRVGFGALLLGVQDKGRGLRYAGRVGTGFDNELLRTLHRKLQALETREAPFHDPPRERDTHWVKPRLVAEVSFTEWTSDGLLRHPSFVGLREDKKAAEVVREKPAAGRARARAEGATVAGVTISHPDKVLYPERKLTKLDVARYLESVAERMVPEVAGRPLMLLRCPEGRDKPCFFQKHPHGALHESLEKVSVREKKGRDSYVVVHDATGLVALLQAGALEIHVWSARVEHIEEPDRMVFDIDPDPGTPWPEVPRTAHRLREALESWGLESFVKTTGGKGLHVVVPLRRGPGWEEVGRFAAAIADRLIRESPEKYTAQLLKQRRQGRIFLDTLRNTRAHTWVAPYSPRAREGATVSCPIRWDDVTPRLDNGRYTVETLSKEMPRPDPWKGMARARQTITAALLKKVTTS